jgi:hypothetical protein
VYFAVQQYSYSGNIFRSNKLAERKVWAKNNFYETIHDEKYAQLLIVLCNFHYNIYFELFLFLLLQNKGTKCKNKNCEKYDRRYQSFLHRN